MESIGEIINKGSTKETLIKMRNKAKGFTQIPNLLIDTNELSPYEKIIFIALKRHMINKNKCWPGYKRIAKIANCGTTTIKKSIKNLKEKGYIDVKRKKNSRVNVYEIIDR